MPGGTTNVQMTRNYRLHSLSERKSIAKLNRDLTQAYFLPADDARSSRVCQRRAAGARLIGSQVRARCAHHLTLSYIKIKMQQLLIVLGTRVRLLSQNEHAGLCFI